MRCLPNQAAIAGASRAPASQPRRPISSKAMSTTQAPSVQPTGLAFALVSLLFVAQLTRASGLVEKECRLDFFRLPQRIKPTNYKLFIKPNLRQFSYQAEVLINLLVKHEPQDYLCPKRSSQEASNSITSELLKQTNREGKRARDGSKKYAKQSNAKKAKTTTTKRKKLQNESDKSVPIFCDRSKIVLHAHRELNISKLHFVTQDGNQIVQVRDFCRDFKNELLVVGLTEALDGATSGKLRIHFSGPIRNDMHGFFRSEYQIAPNTKETRHMAITHFQAPHARKAFPCFDEPNFKSNFELIIEHAAHLRALSNTQPIRQEVVRYGPKRARREVKEAAIGEEGESEQEEVNAIKEIQANDERESADEEEEFTRVHFARTPRMSTYLLAFAVGEFDHIETQVGKLKLAIWTAPGRAQLAQYALASAAKAYAALRDYFEIEQPLEKIDFVAVRELDAGAMENWGLITFTEHFLLLDQNNTSPDDINYATDSITHELSHQWFGNLVTMSWWDDLWLNEGFATWITQLINQQLHPDRQLELIYLVDALNAALNSDASPRTHPIRNKQLQSVQEIEGSFDEITYEKASAVIRMLNDYLGAGQFKLAIRAYLEANLYENTQALDLWQSLESSSQLNVRELMTSWIEQAGFPLLRARLSPDGRTLRIDQERFLECPLAANSSAANSSFSANEQQQVVAGSAAAPEAEPPSGGQKWIVPLALWISNGRERTKLFKVLISERGANIKLPLWFDVRQRAHWLKLNAKFAGFYRVSYEDLRLFKALQLPIEQKLMGASDRLNVICDMFTLLANQQFDMRQFDEALSWFRAEDNDAVLELLARYIASLEAHHYPSAWDRKRLLIEYYLREGKFQVNKSNSLLKSRTRASVASSLVAIENEGVTRDAIELFERLGGEQIAPAFRVPIFSAVARAGTADQVARLVKVMQQLDLGRSHSRLVDAMSDSITASQERNSHQ